jgi:hypothetical protein
MSQAAIVISVSDQPHMHHNGLSGQWTVPARKREEEFAMLVIYPTPETQDIGEGKKVVHWLKALPLAKDIVGLRSDAAAHGFGSPGTKEKWGLLLCEAEPDLPKALLAAIEAEMEYLGENPPDYKYRPDPKSKATVVIDVSASEIKERKIELSARVVEERAKFESECRKLVQKKEVLKAKQTLRSEDMRLIGEAEAMWARGEGERRNINELHVSAARRANREYPWAYIPKQLEPCPGCGGSIPENVITCSLCGAIFDRSKEEYSRMSPSERARALYPERYAEPVAAGGKTK